jgi:hypothetical protein
VRTGCYLYTFLFFQSVIFFIDYHRIILITSKLKELSKRTTFIRVTQQINEIFGSVNEEKKDFSAPSSSTAATASASAKLSTPKRGREE